ALVITKSLGQFLSTTASCIVCSRIERSAARTLTSNAGFPATNSVRNCSSRSLLLATRNRSLARAASCRASSRPIPAEAPVITAEQLSRFIVIPSESRGIPLRNLKAAATGSVGASRTGGFGRDNANFLGAQVSPFPGRKIMQSQIAHSNSRQFFRVKSETLEHAPDL